MPVSRVTICRGCGWGQATNDGYCLECSPDEGYADADAPFDVASCQMCGAPFEDGCHCFDPQGRP